MKMSLLRREMQLVKTIFPLTAPHIRFLSSRTSTTTAATTTFGNAKPFTEIPLVKGYPVIGSTVEFLWNLPRLHELLQERVKQYGPIYREHIGGEQMVFTTNPGRRFIEISLAPRCT